MASVSKLTAYAITGGIPNGVTISKLTAYAIKAGAPNGATVCKLTAYAIIRTPVGPIPAASSGFLMF